MSVTTGGAHSAARKLVLQAIGWAITAALFHSLVPVAVRWLSVKFPPVEVVFLRNVVGFLFLLTLYTGRGIGGLRTKRIGLHIQRSLTNFVGMWLWFAAIAMLPLGEAVALQFTMPLFTVVLAVAILGERPGPVRWSATLIGFLGVVVILRPAGLDIGWPAAMALGSAALYGATQVYTRVLGRTDDPGVTTFYYQCFLTLFSAIPSIVTWVTPSLDDLPAILMLGTVGTIAPYCIIRALSCAEATMTAPFEFLRLPFTVLMAYVFFAESAVIWTWIGGAIIFGSAYFVTWREARGGKRT